MSTAETIRVNRAKKGLTQAELADQMGITRQTVINWEKGVTEPDVNEVKTLSKILEIDPVEITPKENGKENDPDLVFQVYRDLVESNSEYRLIPKIILDNYEIVPKSELAEKAEIVKIAIAAKNDVIVQLKKEIEELRAGQRATVHAKEA